MDKFLSKNRKLFIFLLVIIGIRVITLALYPLYDTTEARYAEMARKMVELNDWITPFIDYGVPYWGKPPMSFWSAAASIKVFGVNEFAVRFPALLLLVLLSWFVFQSLKRLQYSTYHSLLVNLFMWTSGMFYFMAGGVLPDPYLLFGTTLSMLSFWIGYNQQKKSYAYLFFIGVAFSVLSKGPVGIVITVLPLFLWALITKQYKNTEKVISFPWVSGTILSICLFMPWFIISELKTPGYLKYFILDEHIYKYLVPGWHGDRFGNPHPETRGTIFLFWFAGAFPWSIIPFFLLLYRDFRKKIKSIVISNKDWITYLIAWTVAALIFFTFSRNILSTYIVTGVPAYSILLMFFVREIENKNLSINLKELKVKVLCYFSISFLPICTVIITVMINNDFHLKKSHRQLIHSFIQDRSTENKKLIYFKDKKYSSDFYSEGKALKINKLTELKKILNDNQKDYFVIKERRLKKMPIDIQIRLLKIDEYFSYLLLKEK